MKFSAGTYKPYTQSEIKIISDDEDKARQEIRKRIAETMSWYVKDENDENIFCILEDEKCLGCGIPTHELSSIDLCARCMIEQNNL